MQDMHKFGAYTVYVVNDEPYMVSRDDRKLTVEYFSKSLKMHNADDLHDALRINLLIKAGIMLDEKEWRR